MHLGPALSPNQQYRINGFTIWFARSTAFFFWDFCLRAAPNTFVQMYILCPYSSDMMYITYTRQLYLCNLLQCSNTHDVSNACDEGIHAQHASLHAAAV